jgi:ferritin-like protein
MNNENTNFNNAYLKVLNPSEGGVGLDALINKYSSIETATKEDVINLLNIALVDEYLAEFNYYASYNLSKTDGKSDYDPEFKQHEEEERDHRYQITERLRELGVTVPSVKFENFININSNGTMWKQESASTSNDILLNRYNEELNAVKFYGMVFSVLRKLPNEVRDTTTEMLIKKIKADEETHVKDLKDLLIEHDILKSSLTQMTDNSQAEDENE